MPAGELCLKWEAGRLELTLPGDLPVVIDDSAPLVARPCHRSLLAKSATTSHMQEPLAATEDPRPLMPSGSPAEGTRTDESVNSQSDGLIPVHLRQSSTSVKRQLRRHHGLVCAAARAWPQFASGRAECCNSSARAQQVLRFGDEVPDLTLAASASIRYFQFEQPGENAADRQERSVYVTPADSIPAIGSACRQGQSSRRALILVTQIA